MLIIAIIIIIKRKILTLVLWNYNYWLLRVKQNTRFLTTWLSTRFCSTCGGGLANFVFTFVVKKKSLWLPESLLFCSEDSVKANEVKSVTKYDR